MRTRVIGAALALAAATSTRAGAQPASAPGALQDGGIALESGRLDDAERWFRVALAELTSPSAKAWTWFNLCLTYYAAGDHGSAINACYRALAEPATERRVIAVLAEIERAMAASQLEPDGVLPEPMAIWFAPEDVIAKALVAAPPPDEAGIDRVAPPPVIRQPGAPDAIGEEQIERLHGGRPPLPYDAPARSHDYGVGYDVELKTGMLFYGVDTTPYVVGARVDRRTRDYGAGWHTHHYAEYLQAIDGNGGIGAAGVGYGAESALGFETGLSIPWGKDDRRQDVLVPGYTFAVHGEARLSWRHELAIGWSNRISLEASISGGFNIAKFLIRTKDALGDICDRNDGEDCPKTPDANPLWPMGHWMFNLSVAFGTRGRYPRYDHAEVWAPAGGP